VSRRPREKRLENLDHEKRSREGMRSRVSASRTSGVERSYSTSWVSGVDEVIRPREAKSRGSEIASFGASGIGGWRTKSLVPRVARSRVAKSLREKSAS
jgi:hypothetical protein